MQSAIIFAFSILGKEILGVNRFTFLLTKALLAGDRPLHLSCSSAAFASTWHPPRPRHAMLMILADPYNLKGIVCRTFHEPQP